MPEVKHVAVTIAASPAAVYAFAADPENLPRWAVGFFRSVRRTSEGWVADTPFGDAYFRFVGRNDLGVLDHYVRIGAGPEIYNPMRVVAAGEGSLLTFTLFRQPGMGDAEFAADEAAVQADLERLKALLGR